MAVSFFIFFCYSLVTCTTGYLIIRTWFRGLPTLLTLAGAFLIGTGTGIPITYLLSCLFSVVSKEPILYGVLGYIVIGLGVTRYVLRVNKSILSPTTYRFLLNKYSLSDIVLFLFSLLFSFWIMGKTFRAGSEGQIFVGGNTVFDFGHTLGIIRSFSWGANIPISSPFFSGAPFFYHFFFQFWVSLWEYFQVPLVLAVNMPSAFSFAALLIVVYYLPQIIAKQGKLVGWLAVLLTVTHSTLSFWYLLFKRGLSMQFLSDLWNMPTYPFAGPFDGSVISLYTTLNPYVNQRHLGFSVALGLLCLILGFEMIEKKQKMVVQSVCLGFFTGLLFLFNMSVSFFVVLGMGTLYILRKRTKDVLIFVSAVFVAVCILMIPFFSRATDIFAFIRLFYNSGLPSYTSSVVTWTLSQYLWNNMGLLPVIALIGLLVTPKKSRYFFWSLIVLFIITCIFAAVGKRGFDQKFYSFSIIGINVLAAIALGWLCKKNVALKLVAVFLFFILTMSGVMDLFAIKNEFAYPLMSKDTVPVMTWIKKNTLKNAVFVSYSDIIDPVVLSGRKNYFGFFGNAGSTDRSLAVKNIYAGDIRTARSLGISYILIPRWNKNDFPYAVDMMYFTEHNMVVYEDDKYSIFSTVRN